MKRTKTKQAYIEIRIIQIYMEIMFCFVFCFFHKHRKMLPIPSCNFSLTLKIKIKVKHSQKFRIFYSLLKSKPIGIGNFKSHISPKWHFLRKHYGLIQTLKASIKFNLKVSDLTMILWINFAHNGTCFKFLSLTANQYGIFWFCSLRKWF